MRPAPSLRVFVCCVVSRRENWSTLVSGGECIVKQYVYFTHVCSVSNYLPNVDYCCCVHDASLLCCRYHQQWNDFRCVESEDLIDVLYVRYLARSPCERHFFQ